MATSPIFIGATRREVNTISAANTNRDGTGTLVTGFTAGSNGSAIFRIRIKAQATTTAGMIRIFNVFSSSTSLIREIPVSAVTPSATVTTWEGELFFNANEMIAMASGHSLKFATNNAEAFTVSVEGGDY